MSVAKSFNLMLLLGGWSLVNGSPVRLSPSILQALKLRQQHQTDCGFEGNPDLYGLGIRLGVYFQLIASLIANNYHSEIMQDALDTVCIPPLPQSNQNRSAYFLIEHDFSHRSFRFCRQGRSRRQSPNDRSVRDAPNLVRILFLRLPGHQVNGLAAHGIHF